MVWKQQSLQLNKTPFILLDNILFQGEGQDIFEKMLALDFYTSLNKDRVCSSRNSLWINVDGLDSEICVDPSIKFCMVLVTKTETSQQAIDTFHKFVRNLERFES